MDGSQHSPLNRQQGRAPVSAPKPQKDPLTGLFQQDYLSQALSQLLCKQKSERVTASLALLQLENFYEIRRWVGKSEANLLLSDIARLLSQSLPAPVLLCRCAHYEFGALLVDEHSIHAHILIQRVKQALQSAVSDSIPPQLELKCGVGLAQLARAIPSVEVLFARARHNLGLALSRQRDSHGHRLDLEHGATVEVSLPQLLNVLRGNALQLKFQALVNLKADGLRHYEVRCQLPSNDSTFSSSTLFETAVQNALGERIDRWIISKALQLLCEPDADNLRLTVNLTQNSLVSAKFFDWLQPQLMDNSAASEHLVFQISELDILTTQHHMNYFCHRLGELRIKLCISHFGCTSNPFRYLPLLRAHFVKLDASLCDSIRVDHRLQERLINMTSQLHGSGLRVIASMVEDMALLPLLWAANINFVQGFCLHPPSSNMGFHFLQEHTLDLLDPTSVRHTN